MIGKTFYLIGKTCVLCVLWCSFSETLNDLFKREKKKTFSSVYAVCFDSVLIISSSNEFLCQLTYFCFLMINDVCYCSYSSY